MAAATECTCGKPLPSIAVAHLDPYCSRKCAAEAHGCDQPSEAQRKGYNRGKSLNMTPQRSGPFDPVLPLQIAAAERDRTARSVLRSEPKRER